MISKQQKDNEKKKFYWNDYEIPKQSDDWKGSITKFLIMLHPNHILQRPSLTQLVSCTPYARLDSWNLQLFFISLIWTTSPRKWCIEAITLEGIEFSMLCFTVLIPWP